MKADDLLISTKFAPPRLGPRHIPRRLLLDQLREAQRSTIILVTGSPGFGKTILMAQWRQELLKSGAEVSWLSLSSDDRQPLNFSAYLLAALHRLGVPVETEMLHEGDGAISMDAAVAVAVNGAAAIAKDLYLIVDDFHYIDDPWAHRLVQKLLDHSPANLHIAIASRSAPPLNLSRLRVSGQVVELGFGELPFDLQETRAFFEQNLGGVKLSVDEIQLTHDLTGGWPASLQLIAIMLKTRPKARAALRELGWKSSDLQTYLTEDVVAHLPTELIRLIEQLSICRQFNAELAIAITGNPNAASLIQRVEEENLFIYRVESEEIFPWYRFHPLFGAFLTTRLARAGEATLQELHARASRWFVEHGLLIEAVRHAIQGGNLEFAIKAIEDASPESWDFGFVGPMVGLIDRLPQETLVAHPRLLFIGCLTSALLAHPVKAEQWIARIQQTDMVNNPENSIGLTLAAAALAWRGDDTERVIEQLEPLCGRPFKNGLFQHVHVAALVSAYGAAGRYDDAHAILDSNPALFENPRSSLALSMRNHRASTFLIEGRVREASAVAAETLAVAEAMHGRHSVNADLCAAILGDAYYELNRIDDAREVISNRPRIVEWAPPEVLIRAAVSHARLDCLQESADAALSFLAAYDTYYKGMRLDRPRVYLLAEQARILLDTGKRQRANEAANRLYELAQPHHGATGFFAEIPALADATRARFLFADRRIEDALAALTPVRQYAERTGRRRLLARTELQRAIALSGLRRGGEAIEAAVRTVRLGFDLGLVRTILDEGGRAGEALRALHERKSDLIDEAETAYLESLLDLFVDARHGGSYGADASPSVTGDQIALTPRELEVLALICHAMPNKRIALALNITLETVKWNVKNILAKLGVSNRYDAIAKARQLGLTR